MLHGVNFHVASYNTCPLGSRRRLWRKPQRGESPRVSERCRGPCGLLREIYFFVLESDNFLKNPSLSSSSITLSSTNCPRLISPFSSTLCRTSSRALLTPPRSTRGGKENFGP